jgi:Flp pilus assembly secretin CpaC
MAVIDKLDIRRAQVQVEALIVEIDVNKSSNLGVQWILYGQGNTTLRRQASPTFRAAGTPGIVDLAAAALSGGVSSAATTGASAISSATIGTGATVGDRALQRQLGTNFAAIIQALRSDGSSNIISTPSLITMNNEEAEVKVTQEIPLITGSYSNSTASTNGTTSPFTTIQREEVGTILKVTPHINEGNSVQLKIEQEDSSPGAKLTNSADISTNKRSIKTTVLIEDGGIIVLGGLMSDTVTESEDRVPVLGAIPLLGNLFKNRSGSRQKKNLLVFIRPKILRDAEATESTSEAKYNEVRQNQKTLNNGHITLLPGQKQPVVPAMPPGSGLPAPRPRRTNAQGATPNTPPQGATAAAGPRRATAPAPACDDPPARRRTHERRAQRSGVQRKLSFPFAKRHGVLVRGVADGVADTVCRPGVTPQSLAEVRRFIADLLESAYDDAPIIRLINAVLTQAVRENASDIHIEAVRESPGGALSGRRRAARSAADQARGRAAGGVAHQGHVQARHRREAPAAGRPHQPAHRRPRGRRARLDHALGHGERVVLRLLDKQAGRSSSLPRHGPAHPGAHG